MKEKLRIVHKRSKKKRFVWNLSSKRLRMILVKLDLLWRQQRGQSML